MTSEIKANNVYVIKFNLKIFVSINWSFTIALAPKTNRRTILIIRKNNEMLIKYIPTLVGGSLKANSEKLLELTAEKPNQIPKTNAREILINISIIGQMYPCLDFIESLPSCQSSAFVHQYICLLHLHLQSSQKWHQAAYNNRYWKH